MNNLTNELDRFTEVELAYFIKYRLPGFDTQTAQKIISYIVQERKLDPNCAEEMIRSYEHERNHGQKCKRCRSNKFITNAEVSYCEVCGKVVMPGKLITFLNRLSNSI